MTIQELITILMNRVTNLVETRKLAVHSGNLEQVAFIDIELLKTTTTLEQLKNIEV